ncbi:MAG: hypothetical protein ABF498_08125 [Liquorilactobacillus satsumensis]|uniref:hypothetical protein n=1 Tax=Liquorilactobacillus TaxID=2767888 RepID=UPI001E56F60B|nr:hypothetical protein [Liquorilactobacillus satsumensis]
MAVKVAYQHALTGTHKQKNKWIRKSKSDGFKNIIELKYQDGCSAKAILNFISEKGFQGKYTIVKDYCRQYKRTESKKMATQVDHSSSRLERESFNVQ